MNQVPELRFACPECRAPLLALTEKELRCSREGTAYRQVDGIWRLLPPGRKAFFEQFVVDYTRIRAAEGRGSTDPAYYRVLPFQDLSGRYSADWHIRATSFQALVREVVLPLEKDRRRPLETLDLGAGNGWLSYRLARRGHRAAAIDLLINEQDGLGTAGYYDTPFLPIQADFDHLPFVQDQLDLVIFNASLHYSTHYETTLREALRVLNPGGVLVILDSPLYRSASSGEQMVHEREQQFQARYGFPSNAIPSENYLTYQRLQDLSRALGVLWNVYQPFYGLGWALRPWKARLRGQREPAQFGLIAARRPVEAAIDGR